MLGTLGWLEGLRLTGLQAAQHGLAHADIHEAFFAIGFRALTIGHALQEVAGLAGELILGAVLLGLGAIAGIDEVAQRSIIAPLEGSVGLHIALGSGQGEALLADSGIGRGELSGAAAGKSQSDGHGGRDLQLGVMLFGATLFRTDGVHGGWFLAVEVAHGVQRVYTQVRHGAGPEALLSAVVVRVDHVAEGGGEGAQLTQSAGLHEFHQIQEERIVVHAVGQHEGGVGIVGSIDHPLAILHGRSHGLFTQHGNARLKCGNGVLRVLVNWGGNVHGIDIAGSQQLCVLIVGISGHTEVLTLGGIGADNCGEFCLWKLCQARDECLLSDLSRANNCESSDGIFCVRGHAFHATEFLMSSRLARNS